MKGAILILALVGASFCSAQEPDSTSLVYTIDAATTVSPIISFFQEPRYPGAPSEPSFGYGGFLRVNWRPGRLLTFGILTGWAFLAHDDLPSNHSLQDESTPTASATLTAIPLQVWVSMKTERFETGLGMGPYLMMTKLQSEDVSNGSRFELGITFLASYSIPINNMFRFGPELRILYLDYRGIFSIMPSLTCSATLHSY